MFYFLSDLSLEVIVDTTNQAKCMFIRCQKHSVLYWIKPSGNPNLLFVYDGWSCMNGTAVFVKENCSYWLKLVRTHQLTWYRQWETCVHKERSLILATRAFGMNAVQIMSQSRRHMVICSQFAKLYCRGQVLYIFLYIQSSGHLLSKFAIWKKMFSL